MITPAPLDLAPAWEVTKGVMLALTTGGALWTARTVFVIRDEVRSVSHELFGKDGNNGMRSVLKSHTEELARINARNIAMDAVSAAEHDEYVGEERRHDNRRLRDMIREELDKTTGPTLTPRKS